MISFIDMRKCIPGETSLIFIEMRTWEDVCPAERNCPHQPPSCFMQYMKRLLFPTGNTLTH